VRPGREYVRAVSNGAGRAALDKLMADVEARLLLMRAADEHRAARRLENLAQGSFPHLQ